MNPAASVHAVATATLRAVRRRDHGHAGDPTCHPHDVEQIDLGRDTAVVCHDCDWTSPWVPRSLAWSAASQHLLATA